MRNTGSLRHRFLLPLGLLVLALLVAACGGSPQQPATYTVSGTVKDDAGAALAGVTLQFSGTTTTAETDGDGKWTSPGLRGNVTVTPVHSSYNFEPATRSVSKATARVNFTGVKQSGPVDPGPGDPGAPDPDPDPDDPDPLPGDPAPGDLIEIYTLQDLQAVRDNPGGHYILMNNIDASDTRNWNDDEGFKPIGYRETPGGIVDNSPFTGTFDGGGHIIEGLYISRSGKSETGLFGRVDGGTIRNVGLIDADIHQRNASIVGALVGALYDGTIENSYSTGSVTKEGTGDIQVGGLVGVNYGGTIRDSYSSASVTSGWHTVGGLVGESQGGLIERSYSTGTVEGGEVVGGLVGFNHALLNQGEIGIIKDSYSLSAVNGSKFVGGLVGDNRNGEIHTSYSAGEVRGSNPSGGLVGNGNRNSVVEDSYWDTETSKWPSSSDWWAHGEGKETAHMKAGGPFSGSWLPSVWSFQVGAYPDLIDNPR